MTDKNHKQPIVCGTDFLPRRPKRTLKRELDSRVSTSDRESASGLDADKAPEMLMKNSIQSMLSGSNRAK
jgi:hypothetical protein